MSWAYGDSKSQEEKAGHALQPADDEWAEQEKVSDNLERSGNRRRMSGVRVHHQSRVT